MITPLLDLVYRVGKYFEKSLKYTKIAYDVSSICLAYQA
jgi:hypothetical protein